MGKILSRFSVKWQICLVAALGVLGLLGLGATYFVSNSNLAATQTRLDAASVTRAELIEIEIGLLQARRAEKDFLLRNTEDYATRHAATMREIQAHAAKVITQVGDPQLAGQLRNLGTGIDNYGKQFAGVVAAQRTLGLNETSGLLGRLRQSVHEVETRLNEFREWHLSTLMLQMRRHEKDFMMRRAPRYADEMRKVAAEFGTALNASSIPAAAQADIRTRMAAYQTDFFAMLDGTLARDTEIKKLSDIYSAFEPVLDGVSKRIVEDFQQMEAAMTASRNTTSFIMTATILAITVLVALLGCVVSLGVSRPIAGMTSAMAQLAGGDTGAEIPGVGRKDEIGSMAAAVQVFKDNMIKANELAAEQKAEQERKEKRQLAIEGFIATFDQSVSSSLGLLASASTELQSTAQSMSGTAEETSRQSTAVAAASEQASTNVQTVASAAEELSSSIAEISRQVSESATIAGKAVDDATRTNAQVQALAEAAQKIGEVVSLINDIAAQTNLLALNATIEAARAGEAGKGFAVVASEVKSLANQTAKATEDIAAQVKAIQGATTDSVHAIKGIGETIGRINEIATTIASAVEEQGAATQEIARNVQQASAGTNEVSSNIAGVTQAAGETGAAASQVLGAAGELAKQGETLRASVNDFLASIRAA